MDLAQPPPCRPLAVVMDDMGQRLEAAEALTALPFPVTLAIWPHAPLAAENRARLTEERRLTASSTCPWRPCSDRTADGRTPAPAHC